MRLTRKASRWIAFGVVAAVISGAVVAINLSRSASKSSGTSLDAHKTVPEKSLINGDNYAEKTTGDLSKPTQAGAVETSARNDSSDDVTDADLASGFTLENFNRSENKEGKKLWEISGEKGLISTSGNKARIEKTKLSFFREDNSLVILTAPKANLKIEGGLVSLANLSGGVFVEQVKALPNNSIQQYSASSEAASFDRIANLVTTNSTTIINSRMATLTSGAVRADLTKKVVFFHKGVRTLIRPDVKGFSLSGKSSFGAKDKVIGPNRERDKVRENDKPASPKPSKTKISPTVSKIQTLESDKIRSSSSNSAPPLKNSATKKVSTKKGYLSPKSQVKKNKDIKTKDKLAKVKVLAAKDKRVKIVKKADGK